MKRIRQLLIGCVVLALATLPMGCKKHELRERGDALNYSIQVYGSMVRWGEWPDAAAYHKPREGEPVLPDFERLDGIRVTDYKILGSVGNPDSGEAVVETRIDYHLAFDNRIRTLHQRQQWYYNEDDERWWLESPFPDF